jgi:hypothetical protein
MSLKALLFAVISLSLAGCASPYADADDDRVWIYSGGGYNLERYDSYDYYRATPLERRWNDDRYYRQYHRGDPRHDHRYRQALPRHGYRRLPPPPPRYYQQPRHYGAPGYGGPRPQGRPQGGVIRGMPRR